MLDSYRNSINLPSLLFFAYCRRQASGTKQFNKDESQYSTMVVLPFANHQLLHKFQTLEANRLPIYHWKGPFSTARWQGNRPAASHTKKPPIGPSQSISEAKAWILHSSFVGTLDESLFSAQGSRNGKSMAKVRFDESPWYMQSSSYSCSSAHPPTSNRTWYVKKLRKEKTKEIASGSQKMKTPRLPFRRDKWEIFKRQPRNKPFICNIGIWCRLSSLLKDISSQAWPFLSLAKCEGSIKSCENFTAKISARRLSIRVCLCLSC